MAEDHHDIDYAFRDRFEGLKDHSVDPASQWVAVEHGLSAGSVGFSATTAASGASPWAMAASFAGIIAVSAVVTMDHQPILEDDRSLGVSTNAEAIIAVPTQKAITWKQARTEAAASTMLADRSNTTLNGSALAEKPTYAESQPSTEGALTLVETPNTDNRFVDASPTAAQREHLDRMDVLSLEPGASGIVNRNALAAEEVPVSGHVRDGFYLRGGVRFGKGESNSSHVQAKWRVNNVMTAGFALHFTPKTFVSMEVGHVRRGGNGIERSKDVDFGPLIGVIASAYDDAAVQGALSELNHIRESLVATTMDYVHVPIQLHVDLHEGSNASIGMYADYLVRVKNESYMVYNSRDYISANFGLNDDHTMDGLNRVRLGLMAGFQQQLSNHIVADVRGMIPVSSQYDRKSDYSLHKEPSQLVDFQFSLIYKI